MREEGEMERGTRQKRKKRARAEGRGREEKKGGDGRCGKMREDDGRAGKGRQEKRKTWAGQFLIHPPTSRSPAPGGPYVTVIYGGSW